MANFCAGVVYSSCLWKLAFLLGLCGIACCAAGMCTPNFIEALSVNYTLDFKWGLFESCVRHRDKIGSGWSCDTYFREDETVYLIVCRYVILGELVCAIFGTFCHFFSPLQRPACKVKHSAYYFIAAMFPGIIGPAVYVSYLKDDVDVLDSKRQNMFDVSMSWSLYTTIGACGIFLAAAIACLLEVRRVHRERWRSDSLPMA